MIRLLLFGSPELRVDDGRGPLLPLAQAKHLALLAYLTVGQCTPQRREHLASMFWPDLSDARSRNALSKAVHHLRSALGDDVFVGGGSDTLGVNGAHLQSDVAAFDAAALAGAHELALSLHARGELLTGFSIPASNDFDGWANGHRVRLMRVALQSASALADHHAHHARLVLAIDWAQRATEISPYDETAHRRHVTLLHHAGNRVEALRVHQAFIARIARELDASPSVETRAVGESLHREPVARPGTALIAPSVHVIERSAPSVPPPTATLGPTDASASVLPGSIALVSRPSPRTRWRMIGVVCGAAAVLAVTAYAWRSGQNNLVAVTALRDRTSDRSVAVLAEMATGSIVQDLVQNGVSVVDMSRNARSAPADRADEKRSSSLRADAGGAGTVIRGDIFGRGDSLRVQMQIVKASDGRVLHQLDPIYAGHGNAHAILNRLRSGVSGAIAALADTLYQPWSRAHSRPPNFEAFQAFMQGLDAVVHAGPRPAVEHLTRAVTLDTGFVEAKIWLLEQADMMPNRRAFVDSISAAALAQRDRMGPFDRIALDRQLAFLNGRLESVYSASRRLVSIAPTTQDAQVYLAQASMATRRYAEARDVLHRMDRRSGWLKDLSQLWQWDLDAHRLLGDEQGALNEWTRLRTDMPADYRLCNAGVIVQASMGREREVDALIDECAALSGAPASKDRMYLTAGRAFRSRGYADASRRAFAHSIEALRASSLTDARRTRAIGFVQCELQQWSAAYEALRANIDTANAGDRVTLAVVAAHVGDTALVMVTLAWIDGWKAEGPQRGQDDLARAFIYTALGDTDRAITLLRDAANSGSAPAWTAWYIRFELDPLRRDARFAELIRPRTQ